MNKQLTAIVISSALLASAAQNASADDAINSTDDNDHYIGAGIGAVTGALFAGPVGFLAGGLIGSLAGKHNAASIEGATESLAIDEKDITAPTQADHSPTAEHESEQSIVVAQSGEIASVIKNDTTEEPPVIDTRPISDLNFNVFFLSGSTSVEAFYKPQIQAIARLVQQLPELEVHLDGYSDRRGDVDENLSLANQRLDAVRNVLEQAGINANRIHPSAYGEQGFVSRPGDLDAYTFDRRVVIRFEHATTHSENPIALMENTLAQ